MPVSLTEFVRKWKISSLSELQSAQSHFNELCDLLGQPTPTDADPTGEFFCFNKALTKNYGGKGFAAQPANPPKPRPRKKPLSPSPADATPPPA